MKQRIKPVVTGLVMLGLVSSPVLADNSNKTILALQQQVDLLEQKVNSMNGNENVPSTKKHVKKTKHQTVRKKSTQPSGTPVTLTSAEVAAEHADAKTPQAGIIGPNNLPDAGLTYLPVDFDVPGQSFVSTGPYLGVPLSYSGSNLIINTPSINEDVSLLKLRKNVDERLAALGIQHPEDHSHLLLSGAVEGGVYYKSGNNSSDVDVTNAELDAYILGPSSWTSGLMSFNYENDSGAASGSMSNTHRTFNSRVFINKAFITIGDFTKTPAYATVGQMFVPFGTYSSNMVSSPMTKILFRTKARALLFGYQPQVSNTLYGSTYIFRGDSHAGSSGQINNGGLNLGLKYDTGAISGDIGGGYIGNVADSDGMQITGNTPNWGGFGSLATTCGPLGTSACGNEQLVHRVPGYDLRGTLSWRSFDFLVEYITASTSFNPNDMTFNSNGAKPQALDAEAAYTFTTFGNKPTSIALGYSMSKDALAIGVPQTRYSAVMNMSWWRNTLQSVEFRHDVNYPASATATGSGVAAANGTGQSDNVVTAQIDIYF